MNKKKIGNESEQTKRPEKESEQKSEGDKNKLSENLRENKRERETKKNEREKKRLKLNDERKTNYYANASEVKRALFLNKPMIILLYKEALFNTNQLDTSLPSSIVSLL